MNRQTVLAALVVAFLQTVLHSELPPLENRVIEHSCPNGIKLLILERHFSPTVSIRMMFRTGAVDEASGKTGLAHMFEHMMFKGTHTLGTKDYAAEVPLLKLLDELHRQLDVEKSKKDNADQARIGQLIDQINVVDKKESALIIENELWNLYEKEGATELNAATSHDFTQYVTDLPSNKLELWAILDSDRVRNPVFRQFYSEREVVKEERRMRVDTNPEGKIYEQFLATAFIQHPYRYPTIGWETDIDHLTVGDLENFYQRYYTPDQLTIVVVGDVKASNVMAMVDRYFGTWTVKAPSRPVILDDPPQSGTRRVVVKFDAQPYVLIGFHIPTYPDPEKPVNYALAQLLGNGTTSRLYKTLVEKKKLATSIETSDDYPGERYPSLLIIGASPRFPHTPEEVLQAIQKELDRLKKEPLADWEVPKIRAALDMGILTTLQTNDGMAETLAYDQCIFGDWRYLLRFEKRIQQLTAQDIQNAAKKIFNPENETIAVLESSKPRGTPNANPNGYRRPRDGD